MAQWTSTCTLTDKACGFKRHGRLHWSYLAEKVSLITSHLWLKDLPKTQLLLLDLEKKLDLYIKLIKGKCIFPAAEILSPNCLSWWDSRVLTKTVG